MAEGYSLVKTIVQILHHGQTGFADLGEKLKRPDLREYFLAESVTVANSLPNLRPNWRSQRAILKI